MELPSTGAVVAVFLAFWAGMFVWIGIRVFRESKQQHLERQAVIEEVASRARAKGRRFAKGTGEIDWIVEGTLPDRGAWSLTCRAENMSAGLGKPHRRDTISSHSLKWQAPAIRRDRQAFRFERRSEEAPPGELSLEGNEALWRRWRLVAQDEALARRVFDAAVCALLEKLPPPFASNTCEDERTSIVLGPGGLEFVLGVNNPGAGLADLIIAICEAIAEREKGPKPDTR